jgi:hypothetical protein
MLKTDPCASLADEFAAKTIQRQSVIKITRSKLKLATQGSEQAQAKEIVKYECCHRYPHN